MKKKSIIFIALLLFIILYQYSQYNDIKLSYSHQEDMLIKEKYMLEEDVNELENENKRLKELESDIEVYKSVLPTLFDSMSVETMKKLYNIDAYFVIDNKRVEIPITGDLYTKAESLDFIVSFDPIGDLSDERMDKLFKNVLIAPVFRSLYYPSSPNSVQTDALLHLNYSLEIDEVITLKLTNRFSDLFSIASDTIKIVRYNPEDYDKGSDYYTNKLMKKHFQNMFGILVEDYIEVDDSYVIYRSVEEGIETDESYNRVVNILDGAVGTSGESHNLPFDTDEIPYKLLPESIILGYEWDRFGPFASTITAIDQEIVLLDTTFKCVEVTEQTPSGIIKTYYAKGIGEILTISNEKVIRQLVGLDYE